MRHGVIMAGGSGTRLWPLSRDDRPKQLLTVNGGRSLLQLAYERLLGPLEPSSIFVCTLAEHRDAVLAALPGLPPDNVLGEPIGRDTATAVGFSAAVIAELDPEAVLAVVTADHVIEPVAEFQAALVRGFELAERGDRLVTFGVVATHPHTGLGYVERGEPVAGTSAYEVAAFHEKPDLATATGYVGSGRCFWNSGMFVWRADVVLAQLQRHLPATRAGLARVAAAWTGDDRQAVLEAVYPGLERISIDYAVLEPAAREGAVAVVPLDVEWLDIGSWPALAGTLAHDAAGNAIGARTVLVDSSGNVLVADDPAHLIAAIGLRDMVVVATADVTMVCPRADAERVKELVAAVQAASAG